MMFERGVLDEEITVYGMGLCCGKTTIGWRRAWPSKQDGMPMPSSLNGCVVC